MNQRQKVKTIKLFFELLKTIKLIKEAPDSKNWVRLVALL